VIWQQVMGNYQPEVAALRAEYEQIRMDVQARLGTFSERLRGLWQAMRQDLSAYYDIAEQYPVPEASRGEELGDGLYNSQRDYMEQVEAYKQFQGRM